MAERSPATARLTGSSARQRLSRHWRRRVRRLRNDENAWLGLLAIVTGLIAFAGVTWPDTVSLNLLLVPLVLAHVVLGPRLLPWFVLFALGTLAFWVVSTPVDTRRAGGIAGIVAIAAIILVASFRRSRLGVPGPMGESMLVDLRDRLGKQGRLPQLPEDWYCEAVMRSAGGASFSGDFIVASKSRDDRLLEVAVVDVSGKGEQAGTRALLLSGAFGGLLGALPAGEFLPAANDYLLRQDWAEGFATAVHLSLDIETGDFELRSAGHPPAVQLHSGSGRWGVQAAEGPVLGLIPAAEFAAVSGRLLRGDALLLFTDGLVETPERDISLGIDKLVGQGERLLRAGFEHGARRLIDRLESESDDRALFLVHRR